MKPLSHSQISLYLECPLKYKFRYIDGLKEKPKSALSFGDSVHKAIAFFFGSKLPNPPAMEEVNDYYKKAWVKEGYKDEEEESQYFEYGKTIITDFYEKHTHPYKVPLGVEHDIRFELDGIKVRAIMDRIDKIGDDKVEIIDYKTSKAPFSLSDLADEPQLSMYQFAVEKEMGLKVEKLTYYHLRSQTPFTIPRHGDDNIEALKARILDVTEKIEKEEFPYKENRFCPCDFGHLCPLYMHDYKKEVEKDKKAIDIVAVTDEYGSIKDKEKELKGRADALQTEIKEYMNKEKIERVFGNKYEVTRTKSSQERLDTKKAKKVLEEQNMLEGLINFKEIEAIRYKQKKEEDDF